MSRSPALLARLALAGSPPDDWQVIGQDYGMNGRLWRAPLESGTVIVKLWEATQPDQQREVLFYRHLAPSLPCLRLPDCHHAEWSPEKGRACLVLEDLKGARQGDCLERLKLGDAQAIARKLSALHQQDVPPYEWLIEPPILTREPDWFLTRRHLFLARFADRMGKAELGLLWRVMEIRDRAAERLADCPRVLLHGDFHLDNVLFDAEDDQPIIIDWSHIRRGPLAMDLAELCFEMSEPADIEEVLDTYGLERRLAVRWLGGALLLMLITRTCGLANWQSVNRRDTLITEEGFRRIRPSLRMWREIDPELFSFA